MDSRSTPAGTPHQQLRILYQFMAPRWFVAGRQELVEQGFTESRIKNWWRSGRLVRVTRGVYSLGRDIETRGASYRAALLAAGPGSVLIGRSALEVWGVIKPGSGLPRLIEVGVTSGEARILSGRSPALRQTRIRVSRCGHGPEDIRIREGLALATVPVALIDFSARASEKELRFAFLEACRLGMFGKSDVKRCFVRLAGRRGAKKLRPFLSLWVPELQRIRSVFEGWFLLAWVERKLPMPKVNERVLGYEVDLYWPEYSFVLELDGDAFHGDPVHKALDAEKQRRLEAGGLTVGRVSYRQFADNPGATIDRVFAQLELMNGRPGS